MDLAHVPAIDHSRVSAACSVPACYIRPLAHRQRGRSLSARCAMRGELALVGFPFGDLHPLNEAQLSATILGVQCSLTIDTVQAAPSRSTQVELMLQHATAQPLPAPRAGPGSEAEKLYEALTQAAGQASITSRLRPVGQSRRSGVTRGRIFHRAKPVALLPGAKVVAQHLEYAVPTLPPSRMMAPPPAR